MERGTFKSLKPGDSIKCTRNDGSYTRHFDAGDILEVESVVEDGIYVKQHKPHVCNWDQQARATPTTYTDKCGRWGSCNNFDFVSKAKIIRITAKEKETAIALPSSIDETELMKFFNNGVSRGELPL